MPYAPQLWMIATGTDLGVFMCLLRTAEACERLGQLRLMHGARQAADLSFRDLIAQIERHHPDRFGYIPVISRETCDLALFGRIPAAIADGRLEQRAGLAFSPDASQIMLCGNQDMLHDTAQVLSGLGLRRNRRRTPGHITTERYW